MTRSKRMQRIAILTRSSERSAARALSASQHEWDLQRKQLNDLLAYRDEYCGRFRSGATPMTGFEAQKLRDFVTQIDTVIRALREKVQQLETQYQRDRDAWIQQQHRTNAIDNIRARELRQEILADEARTQRELDERVLTKFGN